MKLPPKSLADEIALFQATPISPRKPRAKRAKSKRPEDELHKQVAKLMTATIARPGVCSPLGVIWYSVEVRAKRSLREGAANKSRGCIAGCPDIDIYYAGRAFKIELKAPKGKLSDGQEQLHIELARAKVPVLEARSLEDVDLVLDTWAIPRRKVTL
jgi:hypothetical protein